jgi:hypothetical protein
VSQEDNALSGGIDLNADPGRSFVITRRNGDSYEVRVSSEDYDRVMDAGSWCVLPQSKYHTRPRVIRYDYSGSQRKCIYLYRFIVNAPAGAQVDHINQNTLDNRRCNLRLASIAQNAQNRAARSTCKSGIKGVWQCRKTLKWRASIKANGARFDLGYHASLEDAAMAFEGASLLLHGSFSRVR